MAINTGLMHLFYITVPSPDVAEQIAKHLISERFAACINIVPTSTSIYEWEGELKHEPETILIAKVGSEQAEAARAAILKLHPFDLPCILSLAPDEATSHLPFIKWVEALGKE